MTDRKYWDGSTESEWRLADGTYIIKTKPNTIYKTNKFTYVRIGEDGEDTEEEFKNFAEVRKFAKKIKTEQAKVLYADSKQGKSAGLDFGKKIYQELKEKYRGKVLKNEILKRIKHWDSRYIRKEYGEFAYGIALQLKRIYSRLK